jgi:hypothetical protein
MDGVGGLDLIRPLKDISPRAGFELLSTRNLAWLSPDLFHHFQSTCESSMKEKIRQATKEEFMAAPLHRGNAEQMSKTMDVSGDGSLTEDEFCSGKGMGKAQGKGANQ